MNKERLEKAKELLEIQGASGNWDYCEYMRGMYNGMELIIAILEEREPVYRDAPVKYKDGKKGLTINVKTVE